MSQELSASNPTVTLKTTHRSGHPWIYQRMVQRPKENIKSGSIVEVVDKAGEWVGRGFFNIHSKISLRLLTVDRAETVDADFFRKKITAAITLRSEALNLDSVSDAYRLIHAEGDCLSGLIADRFADVIVLEFFSLGMFRIKDLVTEVLSEHFPGVRFVPFADDYIQEQEHFTIKREQPLKPVTITEHGVKFLVEPGGKHKTGFFSDQRENRFLLSELCRGKRVLDLCCNTGGFSVYAKTRGQASEALGLDVDDEAIALAIRNSKLNRAGANFIQIDIFKWLREASARNEKFDIVVLDPSKQAHEREELLPALKKYTDMNKLAMQVLAPGGILLSCSCTGLAREEDFIDSIRRAARLAGRTLQIFKISGAASDHPFLISAPEGRYLKAVWARVF